MFKEKRKKNKTELVQVTKATERIYPAKEKNLIAILVTLSRRAESKTKSVVTEKKVKTPKKDAHRQKQTNTKERHIRLKAEKIKKETEAVRRFSMGIVFWLLLRPQIRTYAPEFSLAKRSDARTQERIMGVHEKKINIQERLERHEPTQWILLSIIWYLAMIREQGAHSSQGAGYSKKKKNQKKTHIPMLPSEAVIFAFGS